MHNSLNLAYLFLSSSGVHENDGVWIAANDIDDEGVFRDSFGLVPFSPITMATRAAK